MIFKVSGNPKIAEISPKKEGLGKPHEALKEMDGAPAPSPRPTPAQVLSASAQLITHAGDSLNHIAARDYPENKKLGLVALILANPEITNESKIVPGQTFYLPEISFDKETIRLKDQQFYAIYRRYQTSGSLKKDTSRLQQKNVHFVLRDTKDSKGNVVYRVFLGGYGTEAELETALKNANLKSAKRHKDIGRANQSVGSVKNQAKVVEEAGTDKQEALGNPKVTDIYLYRGMGNDPVIPKYKDNPGISANKFVVVDKAYQATFHKNQKDVITSSPKGALAALSEVQLEQVHVNTFISLQKVDSTCKLDNSFNGFTGQSRANHSSGPFNKQSNMVSFDGIK